MHVCTAVHDLRARLSACRAPSFVPTMGHLHDGHAALVRAARAHGDVTVASIFVNRLQFGPTEDFDTYPRSLEADCALLAGAGCDLVFVPSDAEIYPEAQTFSVLPDPRLAGVLEGAFRPGFFTGVATVVMKLFACVRPTCAVFGEKDYQQLLVIQRMARQFCLDIDIVGVATRRAPDGLAHSSRNVYLSAAERQEASHLHAVLSAAKRRLLEGRTAAAEIERDACAELAQRGWQPDYVAVREATRLRSPGAHRDLVVLGAARLGRTRLTDNLKVTLPRRSP